MTSYMLSAGVVVVRRMNAEIRYLFLRAYDYWDFPKGIVEEAEDPIAGAIREVEEETTLSNLTFTWGRGYKETPPYGKRKIARYYVAESPEGEVDLPVSSELGHPEHDEYRWLRYEAGRELLNDRLRPVLDWAHAKVTASQSPD